MRDDEGMKPAQKPPEPERRRTFNFRVSFGRNPPVDDALDHAVHEAESTPDEAGSAADVRKLSIEFSDGKLRAQDSDHVVDDEKPTPTGDDAREAEMWDRLEHIGTGAFPDTARLHRALRTIVLVLGLSIPVALLIAGLATGQSGETIVFMTLFGLIIGAMFVSTFPGRR